MYFSPALALAALAGTVFAHPGDDIHEEVAKRSVHMRNPERRSLNDCQAEFESNGHHARMMERRMAKAESIRAERGMPDPTEQPFLHHDEVDHETGEVKMASHLSSRDEHLFGRASNCILDPESTEGPYFVSGETIRSDLLTGTKGVNLYLDMELINVNTCKPMPDTYVELWGCNSTGVYTGVVATGNGVGKAAPEEIKNNALRGVLKTNSTGVASFITVVPGHYVGRTNHIHTIIHQGATELPNKTITGGTITHVGQFYFDQSLLTTVEKTTPYNTNKQTQMLNSADALFKQGSAGGDNPVVQIVMMGTKVEDGLYGYVSIGINPSKSYSPKAVNQWTAAGGVPIKGSPWAGYPWYKRDESSAKTEAEAEE